MNEKKLVKNFKDYMVGERGKTILLAYLPTNTKDPIFYFFFCNTDDAYFLG